MATTAAEIAKKVRADIKTARTNGTLPGLPTTAKIAIRSSNFAGGCNISVAVTEVDQTWATTTRPDGYGGTDLLPSRAGKTLGAALTEILHRHAAGHAWGEVRVSGYSVDGGTVHPSTWRPGQD